MIKKISTLVFLLFLALAQANSPTIFDNDQSPVSESTNRFDHEAPEEYSAIQDAPPGNDGNEGGGTTGPGAPVSIDLYEMGLLAAGFTIIILHQVIGRRRRENASQPS